MGSAIICYYSRLKQLDLRYHLMLQRLYVHVHIAYKYTGQNWFFYFFISQPEDGKCKVPKHVVVLHVINSIHISTIIQLRQTNTYTQIQFNYKHNEDDEPYDLPTNLLTRLPNIIRFYAEELLAPRLTSKLEDNPLAAVSDGFFNIIAVTQRIWTPCLSAT